MSNAEKLDLLLHRFLSGFFAIPARQSASGAITFAQMRVLWTHSTKDRRLVLLRLRPKGRQMMAGFRKLRQSRLRKLMTRLGRSDVNRLTDALETLNEIVTRWKGSR